MIYLDNNATTQPDEPVVAAMNLVQSQLWGNPSSVHRFGQAARAKAELARRSLADLIGVKPRFITLAGSGTEAIDLAVRGSLTALGRIGREAERRQIPPAAVVTTRAEHSAVRELAVDLERRECVRVIWASMRADASGVLDLDALRRTLDSNPDVALVSVQWANNETGAIQPVHEIARLCRDRSILFHCDATQWVGKQPARVGPAGDGAADSPAAGAPAVPALDADLLTFSPHKFHGPKGVGVLYARPGVRVAPMIVGEQELGRRGGTENVAAIAGAGAAADLARRWLDNPANIQHGAALRNRFEDRILRAIPEASVNGPPRHDPALRLWNTTNIAFARLEAEALLLLLSEHASSVCCSAGAACSSGSLEPSSVLLATGIPPELAHGSLRFSLSRLTTQSEIDQAASVVIECVERLRKSMAAMP